MVFVEFLCAAARLSLVGMARTIGIHVKKDKQVLTTRASMVVMVGLIRQVNSLPTGTCWMLESEPRAGRSFTSRLRLALSLWDLQGLFCSSHKDDRQSCTVCNAGHQWTTMCCLCCGSCSV